jgi:hypothetical protein
MAARSTAPDRFDREHRPHAAGPDMNNTSSGAKKISVAPSRKPAARRDNRCFPISSSQKPYGQSSLAHHHRFYRFRRAPVQQTDQDRSLKIHANSANFFAVRSAKDIQPHPAR